MVKFWIFVTTEPYYSIIVGSMCFALGYVYAKIPKGSVSADGSP